MPQLRTKQNQAEETPGIQRELAKLRRNWVIVLVCIVVAPIVAFLYSKAQTPEYTSTASLLFNTQETESLLGLGSGPRDTDPQREAATNLKLASLESIAVQTAKALPKSGIGSDEVQAKVTVSPEGESELIGISATDTDPAFAARLANTFAKEFVDFSREIEVAKFKRAQQLAEAQFDGLSEGEKEGAAGRTLEQRIVELGTLASIQSGRAEIAQVATKPEAPSSPDTKRNVALGLVVGIFLAIAAVFLREQLDRRVRDAEELERLYGAPVLGTIPTSRNRGGHGDAAVSEAILMLRANLRYVSGGKSGRSLLFTSAAPQEGKTMIVWNLAQAAAAAGERVLVIEADMRRPTLAEVAGTTNATGLGLVLAGVEQPGEAIRTVRGVDLLPAGPPPPNPAELLEGQQMTKLLELAEENYDRVIIDTPPASLVADAVPLFGAVGSVLVVGRLRKSDRDGVEHLGDQLKRLHAPLVGVVVNGADRPAETGYYRPWQAPERPEAGTNGSAGKAAVLPPPDAPSPRRRDRPSRTRSSSS